VEVTLKDGSRARLRPVRPEDKERIAAGMAQMSHESRYHRFFMAAAKLSDGQLRYLTEVDQQGHVAWVAVDPATPQERGLGIARFVRSSADPALAEFALAVIDAWQGRGLGTCLLAALYLMARKQGIHVLRGVVLPENRMVTRWLAELGAASVPAEGHMQADLRVHRDLSCLPDTPEAQHLRRAIEELQAKI